MPHPGGGWWSFLASQRSSHPGSPSLRAQVDALPAQLGIGTGLLEASLGRGCPSQRQLLLMDGFGGLWLRVPSSPCSLWR